MSKFTKNDFVFGTTKNAFEVVTDVPTPWEFSFPISQRTTMGILEKIQEIEREIARTQKNKATEYHLGLLKAKLAKYRVSY